jgi:hypothetical protein
MSELGMRWIVDAWMGGGLMDLMRGWLDYNFECKQIPCWLLRIAVLPIGGMLLCIR